MDSNKKDRIIAIAGTVLFHIIVLMVLLFACLQYDPTETREWPPVDESEIVFGGEYVMLGDIPDPSVTVSDEPAPQESNTDAASEATDMVDEGTIGVPAPLVTSKQESPAKVKEKEKPEKTGPTKEELAAQEKAKKEKEAAEKINNRVKFGGSGSGNGKAGQTDGNATTGAVKGAPGHNLKGRTVDHWGRPSSALSGTIRIKVVVNKQGKVIGTPTYVGGEGPAAANMSVRNSCIAASRESQFSVSLDGPATQTGVITWRFE